MYLDLATSYVCLQSAVGCRQPRKFIASNQWHDDPTPSIHTSRSTRTHFFFLCFAKLFIIINSLWARFNLNRRVGTQLKTYKNSSFGRKNEFCWLKPRSYVPNDTSRTKSRNDLAYSQIRFISLDHCGCSTLPSRTCRQLYIEQKCATYAIQWGGGKNRYLKINMFYLHISLFQSKPTQIFERIIFVFFLSRQFDRITIRTMSAGAPCSIYSFIYINEFATAVDIWGRMLCIRALCVQSIVGIEVYATSFDAMQTKETI